VRADDKNETEKTDKKDGKHAVSCTKKAETECWNYPPTKFPVQMTPSGKPDQAVKCI
jgi:hypothetical protein